YSRSWGYLVELQKRMDGVGAADISGWIQRAYGLGGALPNTEHYVERATKDPRYKQARNARPPRKIQSQLALFDCITCDLCVPVCPNAANFTFALPRLDVPIVKLRKEGSRWRARADGRLVILERHQIANFADFCNDCGNCDVFCPEDGGPYLVKPRFFGSLSDWRRYADLDGFFLERSGERELVLGRIQGNECRLETDGNTLVYSGEGFELLIQSLDDPLAGLSGTATAEVDLSYCRILCWVRDAVYARDALNWPSCLQRDLPSTDVSESYTDP
ncbi:MAG: 4Fe-4S dicluster domain-containing protein, partial [Planctomycetota bacterium]